MNKTCYLCKSDEDDELLYGKFYTKWSLSVHYYCLLLSSNLVQNGATDEVGIFGFLARDIQRENQRTKRCRCYICKQMHANISCCAKKCLRTFHTVCGIQHRCLSHYTDTFQSWCSAHVPLKVDCKPHSAEELCSICYDDMGRYDKLTSIRAPCCKNGWFHKQCVARFAQTAGYFFKCPLCNNVDTFIQQITLRGVFVPERDAAWELEPDAFQDQLIRPSVCDAEKCKCTEGRETDNQHWNLLICGSCGSTCRHQECIESTESQTYVCQLCRSIVGVEVSQPVADDDDNDLDSSSSEGVDDDARKRADTEKGPSSGSGESGVHCSSSDESFVNVRRTKRRRFIIQSDASDSDQTDSSSSIRCHAKRKTGKRALRVISEDSEESGTESVKNKPDLQKATARVGNDSNDLSCQSSCERLNDEQSKESLNTSGASSIIVHRRNTMRAAASFNGSRLIGSSDESVIHAEFIERVKRVGARNVRKTRKSSSSITRNVLKMKSYDSDSSDDDAPLSKHFCIMTAKCSQLNKQKIDMLNNSNEENSVPTNHQKNTINHSTPPSLISNTTGSDNEKSGGARTEKCRLQQSIMKFFMQSQRFSPSETSGSVEQETALSNTDSPASSSSNFSRSTDFKVRARAITKIKQHSRGGPSAAKRKLQSPRRRKASKSRNKVDKGADDTGTQKAVRRSRGRFMGMKKSQNNLLQFFNRC